MGISKGEKGREGEGKGFADLSDAEKKLVQEITKNSLLGTVSIGVASYQSGDTKDTLKKRADEALYFAKASGRNAVCNARELEKIGSEEKESLKKNF